VLEVRALVRLYVDLLGEYIGWRQRLQATLFHHGVPVTSRLTPDLLDRIDLSPAGRDALTTGLRQLDRLSAELDPLRRRLHRYAARQAGCLALQSHYGIGPLTGGHLSRQGPAVAPWPSPANSSAAATLRALGEKAWAPAELD
jgi:hypothetical protein